jgi:hypothetical protein
MSLLDILWLLSAALVGTLVACAIPRCVAVIDRIVRRRHNLCATVEAATRVQERSR